MKYITKYFSCLILLVIIIFGFGCNMPWDNSVSAIESNDLKQKFLFELEHINFAWGYNHYGFYIDNEGSIYSYQYSKNDKKFDFNENKFYTEEELSEKYSHLKKLIKVIDIKILNEKSKLIESASKGNYSERVGMGADQGGTDYIAYLFDPKINKYKVVELCVEGDWSYFNLSDSAKDLTSWLKNILKTEEIFK
ncbi:MAG: hypothetical protein PHX78_06735 [bacterium]|nr:hypothetical protein [bacterium]